MKCNVGKTDRTVRIVIGVLIIVLGLFFQSWWGLLGLLPLATGIKGYCLPYKWFGWNTNKS